MKMVLVLASLLFAALTGHAQVRADYNAKLPTDIKPGFSSKTELSLALANGNTNSQNYDLKQTSSYMWKEDILRLSGHYLRMIADNIETARNWDVGLRYDRVLSDASSIFVGEGAESDPYAGYTERYNSDLGMKYFVHRDRRSELFIESGYRHTEEHWIDREVLLLQYFRNHFKMAQKINDTVIAQFWIEHLQNILTVRDFKLNAEVSVSSKLSEVLSLKTAYSLRFNNMPPENAFIKSDTLFSTALVLEL